MLFAAVPAVPPFTYHSSSSVNKWAFWQLQPQLRRPSWLALIGPSAADANKAAATIYVNVWQRECCQQEVLQITQEACRTTTQLGISAFFHPTFCHYSTSLHRCLFPPIPISGKAIKGKEKEGSLIALLTDQRILWLSAAAMLLYIFSGDG